MATDKIEDWKLKSSDECKRELGFEQVNGIVWERKDDDNKDSDQ